jgi:mRNA interferase MazF
MSVKRGDVVLLRFPFSGGGGAKVRPALVIQSDRNNRRLVNTIVAMITSTTQHALAESTQLLIDTATPQGQRSGLLHTSVVKCENLFTIEQQVILRTIGQFDATMMAQVDDCLRASLGLV